jgi:hypothetical protein
VFGLFKERRKSKRLEKPFSIAYGADLGRTWTTAYGLNVGLGGMLVMVQKELTADEVPAPRTFES